VWSKIRSWGLKSLRDSQQYLLLSYKEGLRRLSASTFGASKLRLLPKTSTLRPIVNLAKPYRLPMANNPMTMKKKVLSVNTILRTSFDVLNYELSLKPNSFGSGIQYDHIHSKYMKFMMRVRESSADSRELFFASIDIQRCFDNINQDMMYKIVRDFITEVSTNSWIIPFLIPSRGFFIRPCTFIQDEYIIQKYFVVYQSGLEKTVRSKANVENSFNLVPFHQLVTDRINANHTNAIIVDGVNCRAAKRQDILELLHEHLFQNMVRSF
jgi:telomerase reverse transcriptase